MNTNGSAVRKFKVVAPALCTLLTLLSIASLAATPPTTNPNKRTQPNNQGPIGHGPILYPRFDFKSDSVLVHFLMVDDSVLSRTFAACTNLHVKRYRMEERNYFSITGYCFTKNNPQEDLDCPGYNMDAIGTIDNAVQATIRKVTLTLVCDGTG